MVVFFASKEKVSCQSRMQESTILFNHLGTESFLERRWESKTLRMAPMKSSRSLEIREVDCEAGKIFVDSPLALGLLGKKVSDKVSIKIPAGTLNLEILSIRFEQK